MASKTNRQSRLSRERSTTRTRTRRRAAARRRAARRPGLLGSLIKRGLQLGLVLGLILTGWVLWVARDLPDIDGLAEVERSSRITFYDRHDRVIARRGAAHGRIAALDDLPDYLIDAVLAVEDRRFYGHPGVDVIGTGRALVANVRAGRVVQGGSTLTQQLAKNLFLSPDRTVERKVEEMILAFQLEQRFTKDEIIELYLNRVYFGSGAWGIEAASLRYFGKSASQVTLGEAALLAGLLKAPSRYSPVNDAERAAARATVVLDLMAQTGRISPQERVTAASTPIRVSRIASSPGAQYFIDYLTDQVRAISGDQPDSLHVYTTLDIDMQSAAETALETVLVNPDTHAGASQGAVVSLAPDGAIRVMVGGRNYTSSQYNRAVLAHRQPGSAFKAFVYASAFEAGLTPEDIREDEPITIGDWSPQNYNNEYRGPMSLREAFSRSSNMVAVRITEETGRGHVERLAHRFGIESRLQVDRALALGAYEVTPFELARAYLPFANGGHSELPYGLRRVERGDTVIFEQDPQPGPVVLSPRNLALMRDLLETTVREGTGRRAALPGEQAGGKTGTTNDFRDAWFAGYGRGVVTVVWTGNDDNSPTDRATGGGPPARIFSAYLRDVPAEITPVYTPDLADLIEQTTPSDPAPAVETRSEPTDEPEDPIGALLSAIGG